MHVSSTEIYIYACTVNFLPDIQELFHRQYPNSIEVQLFDNFLNYDGLESSYTDQPNCIPICWKVPHTLAIFIQKNEAFLCKSLEHLHVQIIYDIEEAGLIYLLPDKQSETIVSWSNECIVKLEQYLKDVTNTSLPVYKPLFSKLQKKVGETPSLHAEFARDHDELQIAGYSMDVIKLVETIKYMEDTEIIQEEYISLDRKTITYINEMKIDKLRKEHPDFIIDANIEESMVLLKGNKWGMETLKLKVEEIKVFSCLIDFSSNVTQYLASATHHQNIIKRLLTVFSVKAIVYYEKEAQAFFAVSSDKHAATLLAERLEKKIGCDELTITSDFDEKLFGSQMYCAFRNQLSTEYIVDIDKPYNDNVIKLCGNCQNMTVVKQKLQDFIRRIIGKKIISLNRIQWLFLSRLMPEWRIILTEKLKPGSQYSNVIIKLPDSEFCPTIRLEGEESKIMLLHDEIMGLVDSICTSDSPILITQPFRC